MPAEALRSRQTRKSWRSRRCYGALLKNEQDVHLFDRLACPELAQRLVRGRS